MSTPSVIERIADAIDQLINTYEDDEYVHHKLTELHALFVAHHFLDAFNKLQDLKEQITQPSPQGTLK